MATSTRMRPIAGFSDIRLSLNNFDLLRTALALTVLLFHLGAVSGVPQLVWLRDYSPAHFAVQCFFFISGFLVTMSWERSTPGSYFSKRARRIFPGYAFAVVGAAILLAPLSKLPLHEYFAHRDFWRYVGFNLLLANFVQPTLPGLFADNVATAVNGALWSIKIEVAFYCAVPVIAWLQRRFSYAPVALLFASLAWRIGCFILADRTGNPFWARLAIQLPGQLAFFLLGAVAYRRTRDGLPGPTSATAGFACALYALTGGNTHQALAPFCTAVFIYWAAISFPAVKFNVNRYGDISYGLYIYHWPVIQTLVAVGLFAEAWPFGAAASIEIVLLIAYASWHFLERPAIFYGRENLRAPPPSKLGYPAHA